jgi:hypothetical protein
MKAGQCNERVADAEVLDADAVASICKAARETAVDKMNSGTLPGVKIGREWICTRTALLAELTRLSLANVNRMAPEPAPAPAVARLTPATLRQVGPPAVGKGNGRRRKTPPELPPFPDEANTSMGTR